MKITIKPYTAINRKAIKELNVEWLSKYFEVEPNDEIQLSNPEKEIIQKGGYIFYAEAEGNIVGTVTLMKKSESVFELSKMAVTENYKGRGIGEKLLQHSIEFAKQKDIKKLILYSNRSLEAALKLYRKYNFKEVPLENSNYKRADIKMELDFTLIPS